MGDTEEETMNEIRDGYPIAKRPRGRPRKNAVKYNENELRVASSPVYLLCPRFSFKDGCTTILCHNGFPARYDHLDNRGLPLRGPYLCPDYDGCMVRWSRSKEQLDYQVKCGRGQ